GYDFKKMDWASSDRYHLMTEAMRRAFADRAEYMGDTDFVKVPGAGLTDKKYADQLRGTINPERASSSEQVKAGKPAGYESDETTHFTVVDAEGNAVANTYTLNNSYGSGVVAKGTGIIMNDEMDDFAAKPDTPNLYGLIQGQTNAARPRNRVLAARGHKLVDKPRYLGDAEGIMIEEKTGMRLGATDPRRSDGVAIGY